MDSKIKKQNYDKSFNIKVPDPLSSGEPPGSFMSNEFFFVSSTTVSYAEKTQRTACAKLTE